VWEQKTAPAGTEGSGVGAGIERREMGKGWSERVEAQVRGVKAGRG
jgi:hypothetical protein